MKNTFGERIKELRLKNKITQKELAGKLDISSASIIAYERGQKSPSIDVAIKFANYFKESLDHLCGVERQDGKIISFGSVVRTIVAALNTEYLSVTVEDVISFDDEKIGGIASIHPTGIWVQNMFMSSPINDFLVKYAKMAELLNDNILTKEIFDTWLESELSKHDEYVFGDDDLPL